MLKTDELQKIIFNNELTAFQRILLLGLYSLADDKLEVKGTNKKLANFFEKTDICISLALNELKRADYLFVSFDDGNVAKRKITLLRENI